MKRTRHSPEQIIARCRVSADPDVADLSSAAPVIRVAQPFANHSGDWIALGRRSEKAD